VTAPHVIAAGPGDPVANLMRARGVRGNSRDWVVFCGDGTVTDRRGVTARFSGEVPPVHALGGATRAKLVHKSNLYAYTDHSFAQAYWKSGRIVP